MSLDELVVEYIFPCYCLQSFLVFNEEKEGLIFSIRFEGRFYGFSRVLCKIFRQMFLIVGLI